jgi:Uma2 family endonuclease
LLGNCLENSDCLVYPSNRLLFVPECEKTFYPDVSIYCGQRETYTFSPNMTALLNPKVLIEVLSPSTEGYDKDKKWRCYKKINSLQQYILIAQDEFFIRILERTTTENEWIQREYDEISDTIKINNCFLKMQDIYKNTTFALGENHSD